MGVRLSDVTGAKLDPVLQGLIAEIGSLSGRMRSHFEAVSAEFGLAPIEARTLFALQEPTAMGQVAERLGCDASYMTLVADRLESLDYMRREPDPADRRIKRLVITKQGRDLRERMRRRAEHGLPAATGLTSAERRTLLELLTKGNNATTDPIVIDEAR